MKLGLFLGISWLAAQASAVTVCHDYTYFRVSEHILGKGKDTNLNSPVSLKARLRRLGYKRVASLKPGDVAVLQKGDAIIIGDAAQGQPEDHSGFVVDGAGHIDHFIQSLDGQGVAYAPSALDSAFDSRLQVPLVRKGWTVSDLRDRKRVVNGSEMDSIYKHKVFQVFRKAQETLDEVAVWVLDPSHKPPVAGPRPDSNGSPSCTEIKFQPSLGILQYLRPLAPGSTPTRVSVSFVAIPKVIVEGEQVQFYAHIEREPMGQEIADDEIAVSAALESSGPPTKSSGLFVDEARKRIRVSLLDPAKALVKVKDPVTGKFVPDAPPATNNLLFEWPELNEGTLVPFRYINVSCRYFEIIQYRYVRKVMTLDQARKLAEEGG